MARETADQFANRIYASALDVEPELFAKIIRDRDRETAEEMRERAAEWLRVEEGEPTLAEHVHALPLDPPAETGSRVVDGK